MIILAFISGFFLFPIVIVLIFRFAPRIAALLCRPHLIERLLSWLHLSQKVVKASSIVDLQPLVKSLILSNDGTEIFVNIDEPRFTVRLRKKCYKRRNDVVVIEVRNSANNLIHYESAREVMKTNPSFSEHFSPRRKKPNAASVQIDCSVLAPAAIAGILRAIFEAVGVGKSFAISVSETSLDTWPDA